MDWLWTWSGRSFGQREGKDLWTQDGRHVGRFVGDEVYDRAGRDLGEVRHDHRLITDLNKITQRSTPFLPLADRSRQASLPYAHTHRMLAGCDEFPAL